MEDKIKNSNPNYIFANQTINLVVAVLNNEIDIIDLAKQHLTRRGFDYKGNYIGIRNAAFLYRADKGGCCTEQE